MMPNFSLLSSLIGCLGRSSWRLTLYILAPYRVSKNLERSTIYEPQATTKFYTASLSDILPVEILARPLHDVPGRKGLSLLRNFWL